MGKAPLDLDFERDQFRLTFDYRTVVDVFATEAGAGRRAGSRRSRTSTARRAGSGTQRIDPSEKGER
jgi:hypothetical protein